MAQKVVFSETQAPKVPLPLPELPQETPVPAHNGNHKQAIARAKAKYRYPWWASKDPVEAFWGQVNEEVQILPLEKFHSCAKEAMKREVFQHEFSDRQPLAEEFMERISKATLIQLTGKIHPKVFPELRSAVPIVP